MPQCFSIKLHSETQVTGRLGMSGDRSARHARNPSSRVHTAVVKMPEDAGTPNHANRASEGKRSQ